MQPNSPTLRLGSFARLFSGGTPSKQNAAFWEGSIGWLSPKDIKQFSISEATDKVSQAAVAESATQIAPKGAVILVARSGILAHTLPVAVLQKPLAINQDLKAMVIRGTQISPDYLGSYMAVLGNRLLPLITKHGSTVQSIETDELRALKIPVPSLGQQHKISQMFIEALAQKHKQEQAAQSLLSGLDTYLLKELGINLPTTSFSEKVFYSSWQHLTGKRLDPKKYANSTTAIEVAISASPLLQVPLGDITIHKAAGDWGLDEDDPHSDLTYQRCLVIRATEFDNLYNLRLTNDRVKYRLIDKFKLSRLDIQPFDLLVEKSGGSPDQPVGRVALLTPDLFESELLAYSNFVQKFRIDTRRASPSYIFNFLKTMHNIKRTDAMQSQTNGIRNLIGSEYFSQIVILPSIQNQQRIANHMDMIREKAKTVAEQAQTDFAFAKAEIEKLILA